jgi:hypothetical protein
MLYKIHMLASKDCKTADTFIEQVRALITEQLFPNIMSAHEQAQAVLDSVSTALAHCTENYQAANAEITEQGAAITERSTEHRDCRETQNTVSAGVTTCTTKIESAQSLMDGSCNQLGVEYCPNGDCCHPLVSEPSTPQGIKAWLLRNQQAFADAFENYESTYGTCTESTESYDKITKECKTSEATYTSKKDTCDALQDELEHTACVHSQLLVEQCTVYTGCLNGVLGTFEVQKLQIKQQEADRKDEFTSVTNLQCFMDVFDGQCNEDPVKIQQCETKSTDTSVLDLDYPEVPDVPSNCLEPAGAPCGAMFVAAHYSGLPVGAQAKACTPCPQGVIEADLSSNNHVSDEMCSCYTPNAGAAGHNKYVCLDESVGHCSSNQACYSSEPFVKGEWGEACKVTCKCSTPNAGTAGHNQYKCTDGATGYCGANQKCYATEPIVKGQWGDACKA